MMSSSSTSNQLHKNRIRTLISRHSRLPIEKLTLYSCLYHIRPYCSSSTSSLINQQCLTRLLKSNYKCQYQELEQTPEYKLLPNKSTFILGRYMLTLHSSILHLYIIDKYHIVFVGEAACEVKVVFIGICTYSDILRKRHLKQDGFILMTADQRLLLFDFKLKPRMPPGGISFQLNIPVKFLEKTFEYHEHNHMISIHTRYKQRSHLFIVLRIWPCWLSYVFLVEPHIFGNDMRYAAITHELLIVQHQKNSCNLYSLHNILEEYVVKSHPISEHPNETLPINVLITSRPTCLFSFNSERPLFDYAFCSTNHFLTRINDDYIVFHINNELSPVVNGNLKRSWTDNLSPNSQVYFVSTNSDHDCIVDIRESLVHIWQLTHDEATTMKHLYTVNDGSSSTDKSNNQQTTRYGRQTTPNKVLDYSSNVLTDHYFDTHNNLLTLLFESEVSDNALIRLIEHPTGVCHQEINFKKTSANNQLRITHEYDKLIVQELGCHRVILRIFTLQRSR